MLPLLLNSLSLFPVTGLFVFLLAAHGTLKHNQLLKLSGEGMTFVF